ncbi:MAG TPA: FAD-binding oxidoreductase [Candidatus Methylomirabilis sp.]|nr:FAD-binding oxidoreductase [Candidatus Methylomirabilis sp.]
MYWLLNPMPTAPPDLVNDFRAILAPDSIRAASPADVVCGLQPQLVLEPARESELAAALRLANDAGLAVIPRGGGTKLGWGNSPSRADVMVSTKRLDKIIEHVWADLTVTVEAGCTIQSLQAALGRHNQRLAIDPLWPERATVGGILSTNDCGSLRLRFGALRDLIIGVTIALADGTLASSGGKVVKNVAGYDLPKLVTGAFGTLGVITRAVFRLHSLPRYTKTLTITPSNLEATQRLILAVQGSQLAHTAFQVRLAADAGPLIDILFEGTKEGVAAQESQLRRLAANATTAESSDDVWRTSQQFWGSPDSCAVAKITSLPAAIGRTAEIVQRVTQAQNVRWKLAMQAIGIGCLSLEAPLESLHSSLLELRRQVESNGGSLTVLHRPAALPTLDAWGNFGDALPLMRAVKDKFDAKNTLNPGRLLATT